ncbi:uncharacterized protein LOC142823105 isoform X2 [Pelodiscus sinensis]|uniref:uncharacterized protein LOC142823105 isoform X2 n=1 Tax=Pelodiscus sinensis TaxID=13735 RepID=UPI003F6C3B12
MWSMPFCSQLSTSSQRQHCRDRRARKTCEPILMLGCATRTFKPAAVHLCYSLHRELGDSGVRNREGALLLLHRTSHPEELSPAQRLQQRPQPERGGETMGTAGSHCNCKTHKTVALRVAAVIIFGLLMAVIALAVLSGRSPAAWGPCCPDTWVGYLGKCYYFSKTEGNWPDSRSNCSALGASLAGIDTPQEMFFMQHSKGKFDHWIGLWRHPDQPWKWANGTKFNHCCLVPHLWTLRWAPVAASRLLPLHATPLVATPHLPPLHATPLMAAPRLPPLHATLLMAAPRLPPLHATPLMAAPHLPPLHAMPLVAAPCLLPLYWLQ